jgi:hypothetical protein
VIGCPVAESSHRFRRLPFYPILLNGFDYPAIILIDIQDPIVDPQQFTAKRILSEDTMLDHKQFNCMQRSEMIFVATMILILAVALPAWSHGGKSHGGTGFSSLQAVQKATELFDRLIKMDKLEAAWETGLAKIDVSARQAAGKREYVVRFSRIQGDPGSVYFFFDQRGEYSGSNFTGQ